MKAKNNILNWYNRLVEIGLGIVLAVMPFHAFLVITASHFLNQEVLFQSWKELLVSFLFGVWLLYCIRERKVLFKFDSTNIIFLCIVLLSLLVTTFVHPTISAVLFGIKTNLVAIAIFLIAQVPFNKSQIIRKNLLAFVLVPAVVVSLLALLQSFIIPPSWFDFLGYNPSTIDPTQIIDSALKFYRAFSTLGGPNQLGAYLILPLSFSIVYAIKTRRYWLLVSTALILIATIFTYSRSAWLGVGVALVVATVLALKNKMRIAFLIALTLVLVVGGIYVYKTLTGQNSTSQYILLHGRVFQNRIEGSDEGRLQAFTDTTNEVLAQPLGHGLGSSGPASFKASRSVIPENWFLQIAYEIGVIGLALYICAFAALLGDFWRHRNEALALSLFAATIGILVTNLFLHAWADSTLALVVFTLYGLYKGRST